MEKLHLTLRCDFHLLEFVIASREIFDRILAQVLRWELKVMQTSKSKWDNIYLHNWSSEP